MDRQPRRLAQLSALLAAEPYRLARHSHRHKIDAGTQRLHEVVHQIEGIELAAVVKTKGWKQARAYHLARHNSTYNSVSIVENAVEGVVNATVEAWLQVLKVLFCSMPFAIVSVSGQDLAGTCPELFGALKAKDGKGIALVFNLLGNDSAPQLVPE